MPGIIVPDREDYLRRKVSALKAALKDQQQTGKQKAKEAQREIARLRAAYEQAAIAAVTLQRKIERIKQIGNE